MTVQIPYLETLQIQPSWTNFRGRIDRSACIEIRVAEVRRLAGCVEKHPTLRDSRGRPLHITRPLPEERPARTGSRAQGGRVSSGLFTVDAEMLHDLHTTRAPRRLAGDRRTLRANVMRSLPLPLREGPRGWVERRSTEDPTHSKQSKGRNKRKFKHRIDRRNPVHWPPERGLPPNPNSGGARTKMIGITELWSQTLRIEKWAFPKRIQPAYYLICPGHRIQSTHHGEHGGHGEKFGFENRKAKASDRNGNGSAGSDQIPPPCSSVLSVVSAPPLSTCGKGRKDPSTKKCPQRTLKLLMVQCTPAEFRDAKIAQLWINSIPPRLIPQHRSAIHQLETRYGLLIEPRTLLCPRCLGVAYGNDPETTRQGWRRRNGKEDTRAQKCFEDYALLAAHAPSPEVEDSPWRGEGRSQTRRGEGEGGRASSPRGRGQGEGGPAPPPDPSFHDLCRQMQQTRKQMDKIKRLARKAGLT